MRRIDVSKRAAKYLRSLLPKHARQVGDKILDLAKHPEPPDSKPLQGHDYRRADMGEHRIIYRFSEDCLFIALVGKRNDGDVYRKLDRMMG
ncbi:MAG TPA: type II toxin-antitoxin system RelE/ParE family toxin [Candidatus Paceibacterota bacterium]|nr:type II toxin-antitoxin system RelE/ParE family toxin [Candidatus Paceibacterota bacterium]